MNQPKKPDKSLLIITAVILAAFAFRPFVWSMCFDHFSQPAPKPEPDQAVIWYCGYCRQNCPVGHLYCEKHERSHYGRLNESHRQTEQAIDSAYRTMGR